MNKPIILTLTLLACQPAPSGHDHGGAHDEHPGDPGDHDDHDDHAGHGEGATAFTHFTAQTEIFVEVQPLVVGQSAEAAAHMTRLSDYRAFTAGQMTVEMSGGANGPSATVGAPSSPGIFRPQLKPTKAGQTRLTFRFKSGDIDVTHEVGEMEVFANAAAAEEAAQKGAAAEEETPGAISFLKEQQWRMDFNLGLVRTHTIRPAFNAFGTVRPRSDGEAWVSAPLSGRLAAGKGFPRAGTVIKADQIMAVLSPQLAEQGDAATIEAAVEQAAAHLRQTERERRRLEQLVAAGAVASNRLVTARFDEEKARTALATAQRRLRQTRRVDRTDESPAEDGIGLRSPIAGTVVAVDRAPGAWVNEGERLFRVIDLDRLWLEVHVVETHLAELTEPQGLWFEFEGYEQVFHAPAEALVSVGSVIDSRTRTVPVLYELDNADRVYRVGMFADVHVITAKPRQPLAAPVAAILVEAGQPVAYVQTGGETFVRRQLRTGERDGDFIEVLDGLSEGERVVTKGAYTVRLAGSSGQLSAGHHH